MHDWCVVPVRMGWSGSALEDIISSIPAVGMRYHHGYLMIPDIKFWGFFFAYLLLSLQQSLNIVQE